MNRFFSRSPNLHPIEGPKVFILLVMFFLFITGTAWAETIIEPSYYYLAGVSYLSLVFTLHALFFIIATAVYTAFVDQTSNRKLLVAVCGIAILAKGGSRSFIEGQQPFPLAGRIFLARLRLQYLSLLPWWILARKCAWQPRPRGAWQMIMQSIHRRMSL